jgi:hypothetical protein
LKWTFSDSSPFGCGQEVRMGGDLKKLWKINKLAGGRGFGVPQVPQPKIFVLLSNMLKSCCFFSIFSVRNFSKSKNVALYAAPIIPRLIIRS